MFFTLIHASHKIFFLSVKCDGINLIHYFFQRFLFELLSFFGFVKDNWLIQKYSLTLIKISDELIRNDDKCQIGQKSVQLKSLASSVKDFFSSIYAMYSLTNRSLIVMVCEISRGVM